jgi:hypothetical protein
MPAPILTPSDRRPATPNDRMLIAQALAANHAPLAWSAQFDGTRVPMEEPSS